MDKTSTARTRVTSRRTNITMRRVRLTSLFQPEDVLHNIEDVSSENIPPKMLEHMALEYGIGNVRVAVAEVMANMEKSDVHLTPGMAVIHGRLDKVSEPLMSMATFKNGIMFRGKTIYLLVLVLTPPDMPGAYKQIYHALTKSSRSEEDMPMHVASLASPLAVWQYFEAGGHRLPDHLQARHIMTEPQVLLNSEDNLARAIELFLAHKASELPVVTSDRELIGVVTTQRLVKVCMPDYLMWVEDMTPFLNFEPIAEIIRDASSTWLREIMTQDFAHVMEHSPAILAMKEIGRRETNNCYVLREQTLVGVIYLHEFLNSVLH